MSKTVIEKCRDSIAKEYGVHIETILIDLEKVELDRVYLAYFLKIYEEVDTYNRWSRGEISQYYKDENRHCKVFACLGAIHAKTDIENNTPAILIYGYPDVRREEEYAKILRQEYSVELKRIAGCVITDEQESFTREYNTLVRVFIQCRYGNDVWERIERKTEVPFLIETLEKILAGKYPLDDTLTPSKIIKTLGETGKDACAALPVLTKFLDDKNEEVRAAAKQAIQKIKGE